MDYIIQRMGEVIPYCSEEESLVNMIKAMSCEISSTASSSNLVEIIKLEH
jgi:hypothetical protein